jgi:hypothetical protein
MSYAANLLREKIDYGQFQAKYGWMKSLNPQGTCFMMSCRWLGEVVHRPFTTPRDRIETLSRNIAELVLWHAAYRQGMQEKAQRNSTIQNSLGRVGLRSELRKPDDAAIGVGRIPAGPSAQDRQDWEDGDWSGCGLGNIWCVVWKYIQAQKTPYGALMTYVPGPTKEGDAGHTVGEYAPKAGTLLIFDMNAGEFSVSGETEWQSWTGALDSFDTANGKINFVDLIEVWRK